MRKMRRRDSDEHDHNDDYEYYRHLGFKTSFIPNSNHIGNNDFFSWLYIFSFVVVLNSHEAIVNAYFKQSEIFAGRVPLWIELQINPELRGKSTSCNQNHQFQCAVTLF